MRKDTDITTTEHKIGSTTYLVTSLPSENAKGSIKEKVERLIIKDLNAEINNAHFSALK